jgi:hypothetical protein
MKPLKKKKKIVTGSVLLNVKLKLIKKHNTLRKKNTPNITAKHLHPFSLYFSLFLPLVHQAWHGFKRHEPLFVFSHEIR